MKWLIAHLTYRPVWRVTYPNGRQTRLLSKPEALNCKDIWGGEMWIDYNNGYF